MRGGKSSQHLLTDIANDTVSEGRGRQERQTPLQHFMDVGKGWV